MTSARFNPSRTLAAVLLAVGAASAFAQAPAPAAAPAGQPPAMQQGGPRGPGHHRMDPAQREARMQQRLAALKGQLQLAPQQDGAWAAFTNAIKPTARTARPDRAELAALPTPQRIDRMRALRSERIAEQDRRGEAVKAFYATLNPAQQKTFDTQFAQFAQFGKHRGHGHGHDHHGGPAKG